MKWWAKVLIGLGVTILIYFIFQSFHAILGFPGFVANGGGLKPSENQFESPSLKSFLCKLQGDEVYHYCNIPYGEYNNLNEKLQSEFELFCELPNWQPEGDEEFDANKICTIVNTGHESCEPILEWYTHSECNLPALT